MLQEKISVIIPAYNIDQYLGRTLDSILEQTYENLEIIIVNDGSSDNTAAVMEKYSQKDPRIKLIHKENGGVTSARLRGVAEAAGDWIGFVDGDDYIEPDMYERLLKNAVKYSADISHCGFQMVLFTGKVLYYHNSRKIVIQDNHAGIKDLLDGRFVEPGLCNKLYSKAVVTEFIKKVDFDRSIRINEDMLMNYYLFREAKVSVYEDVCPYHYIVRKGSAANASRNVYQLLDPLKVKRILFKETENDKYLHTIMGNHLVRNLVMLSVMKPQGNKELIKPIRKQARRELRGMLKNILIKDTFSKKSKMMALWVSVWPSSYRWVHKAYAVVKGIDNIYEK